MNILAIDPGPEESAYVIYDTSTRHLLKFAKLPNPELLPQVGGHVATMFADHLVIEQVASFGMAVGAEVFETVFWSGRFAQAWERRGGTWTRIKRMEVKMSLCHDSRAKDPNIRQAIIDVFGGKDFAIGRKKTPGPLFGVAGDCWSALAVALTHANKRGAA